MKHKNKKTIKQKNNKTIIFTLFLVIALAVSGCGKKEISKPVANNNDVQQENQDTSANANLNQSASSDVSDVDENQGAGAGEDEVVDEAEEVDTSDWLTYRNEEYGFEVRYPGGWAVEEKNSSYNNDGVMGIFINLNQFEGFYIFPRGEFDYGYGEQIDSINFIIDGKDAVKYVYKNLHLIKFVDESMHKDFRIELHYKDEKNLEKLNMILSTLKFID